MLIKASTLLTSQPFPDQQRWRCFLRFGENSICKSMNRRRSGSMPDLILEIGALFSTETKRDKLHQSYCASRELVHQASELYAGARPTAVFTVKPATVVLRPHDRRHAIVHLGHELVDICGDDREALQPRAVRRFPGVPEAGQCEERRVL